MNKHIDEMSRVILEEPLLGGLQGFEGRIAERLYNAGYRKQREGENISQMHPSDEFICEKCGLIIRDCCRYEIDPDDGDEICYEFPYQFCPRCGMKVKGDKTDA